TGPAHGRGTERSLAGATTPTGRSATTPGRPRPRRRLPRSGNNSRYTRGKRECPGIEQRCPADRIVDRRHALRYVALIAHLLALRDRQTTLMTTNSHRGSAAQRSAPNLEEGHDSAPRVYRVIHSSGCRTATAFENASS